VYGPTVEVGESGLYSYFFLSNFYLFFFSLFFYFYLFNRNAERVDLCDKSGAACGG
jgi:hypothetical protein